MPEIVVLGAGAWGRALAAHAARAGHATTLWARDPAGARARGIAPGIALTGTAPLARRADAVLVALPVQIVRALLRRLAPRGPLVLCAKGIETDSGALPLEAAAAACPGAPMAVLSGPNFAAEIEAGLPAATVLAATDAELRRHLAGLLATPALRLYESDDPLGVQLCGAAKNVIAIGAGVVIGAGFGENARAALVTRGLAEIARLIAAEGGRVETAMGLSGLGDLLLTCTGAASRNFRVGHAIGAGTALAAARAAAGGVAEGIATAPALLARAGAATELPIVTSIADLLAGRLSVADAARRLLERPRRLE